MNGCHYFNQQPFKLGRENFLNLTFFFKKCEENYQTTIIKQIYTS